MRRRKERRQVAGQVVCGSTQEEPTLRLRLSAIVDAPLSKQLCRMVGIMNVFIVEVEKKWFAF
jgi:hypothetical protein